MGGSSRRREEGREAGATARRLPEIVGGLHPWLQSRICTILVAPIAVDRWEAVLSYVAGTLAPPPDLPITPAEAAQPRESHHPLALPPLGSEAALREQLRDLAGSAAELGTLQIAKLPGGGWRVTTHAGLQHQRRTWLARIGRRDLR
mgnify:CR=1 FL=1